MISVAVDVMLISITGYMIVIGLLSFWFMIRMRLILRQQKEGAELLVIWFPAFMTLLMIKKGEL